MGRARCALGVRSRSDVVDKEDGKAGETAAAEGPAERALHIMEGSGVAIPEPVRAKLMRDFKEAEAGDFQSQCSNAVTVFILSRSVRCGLSQTLIDSHRLFGGFVRRSPMAIPEAM